MRLLPCTILFALLPVLGHAEEGAQAKRKERELPKSGLLSSSASSGYGSRATDLPFGGLDLDGRDAAPVSGSVSKLGGDRYVARLFNNTKDEPISVSAEVVQVNRSGTRVRSDSFSTTLAPGQKYERQISAASSVADVQLALRSWKSLKKAAPAADGTATPTPK